MSSNVLWLLLALGLLGAFDTLYYHEWRARLPALGQSAGPELKLHAVRDFLYVPLFATLPFFQWLGWWAVILACLLLAEIAVTIRDFIVEDWVRKPIGGVFAGERATHALMGITYGAMLAYLVPTMLLWWHRHTVLVAQPAESPLGLRWTLVALAIGVALSGGRDLMGAYGLPYGGWSWAAVGRR
jgi:hypothetical protein